MKMKAVTGLKLHLEGTTDRSLGTAELTELGDLVGPSDFWIGNTHPGTDTEKVKEVLVRCAESLEVQNFSILDIRCLTKAENPRSKSWKVSVPSHCKEAMLNPGMYVKGWNHRPFTFRPDQRQKDSQMNGQAVGNPGIVITE